MTTTLINSLQWQDKQIGPETMCVGGGQGMVMLVERPPSGTPWAARLPH
jgi:acetyl-CoA C-acetyltransferase